jgi:hypothetical protein
MPTASSCPAKACAGHGDKNPNQLDQKPQQVRQISSADGTRRPGGIIPLQEGAIIPESPGGIIPLKTGAFIGIGNLSTSPPFPFPARNPAIKPWCFGESRAPKAITGERYQCLASGQKIWCGFEVSESFRYTLF